MLHSMLKLCCILRIIPETTHFYAGLYNGSKKALGAVRFGYNFYGATMSMVLQYLWCYNVYGATISMVLQCLWCYNVYGATMSMVLQCLWCYNAYGATMPMVLQSLWCYNVYGATMSMVLLQIRPIFCTTCLSMKQVDLPHPVMTPLPPSHFFNLAIGVRVA